VYLVTAIRLGVHFRSYLDQAGRFSFHGPTLLLHRTSPNLMRHLEYGNESNRSLGIIILGTLIEFSLVRIFDCGKVFITDSSIKCVRSINYRTTTTT